MEFLKAIMRFRRYIESLKRLTAFQLPSKRILRFNEMVTSFYLVGDNRGAVFFVGLFTREVMIL